MLLRNYVTSLKAAASIPEAFYLHIPFTVSLFRTCMLLLIQSSEVVLRNARLWSHMLNQTQSVIFYTETLHTRDRNILTGGNLCELCLGTKQGKRATCSVQIFKAIKRQYNRSIRLLAATERILRLVSRVYFMVLYQSALWVRTFREQNEIW
jgi:hypothetical protein